MNPLELENISPAYLWIGRHDVIIEKTVNFLQKALCPNSGGDHCVTCQQIIQQQHHAVVWLTPEKQYTLEQLETISKRISFALEPGNQCFFVLQHADFLTPACANSLLKSVEEPPNGYHFIFLAQRADRILPTIVSRCVVQSFASEKHTTSQHPLFPFLVQSNTDPLAFDKELLVSKINERESIELLDDLLTYWVKQYKKISVKKKITSPTSK